MHLDSKAIATLDKIYKINLINSCSGYKAANLIASISENDICNVAVFSSVVHLGSNPPLLGFVLRPTTVPRHTYTNIKQTGVYTINHISEPILADAHHTSAKYDDATSEFEMTSLDKEMLFGFRAPFVKGAPVKIAMRFLEEYHIKANDVLMVIGEIVHLIYDDQLIQPDGFLNLSKGKVATINGLDGYAVPKLKTRFGYQRPKTQK